MYKVGENRAIKYGPEYLHNGLNTRNRNRHTPLAVCKMAYKVKKIWTEQKTWSPYSARKLFTGLATADLMA